MPRRADARRLPQRVVTESARARKKRLLLKLAGRETMLILVVNGLVVNGALPLDIVSKSVLCTLYSVKKVS